MAPYAKVSFLRGLLYCLVFGLAIVGMAEITTGASFLTYRTSSESKIMLLNRASPGASLIVAGILLILSAVVGFMGATKVTWPWLCMLGAALSLLTALQIIIAVVGFIEAGSVSDKVHRSMFFSLKHYRHGYLGAWNDVQRKHQCCGVDSFTDWDVLFSGQPSNAIYAPKSCCAVVSKEMCSGRYKTLFRRGCFQVLSKAARDKLTTGASLAVAGAVLEIIGIIAAILLSTIYHEKPGYQLY